MTGYGLVYHYIQTPYFATRRPKQRRLTLKPLVANFQVIELYSLGL